MHASLASSKAGRTVGSSFRLYLVVLFRFQINENQSFLAVPPKPIPTRAPKSLRAVQVPYMQKPTGATAAFARTENRCPLDDHEVLERAPGPITQLGREFASLFSQKPVDSLRSRLRPTSAKEPAWALCRPMTRNPKGVDAVQIRISRERQATSVISHFTPFVVSDRAAWTDSAVEVCRMLDCLAECWQWSEARALSDPADTLLLDVTGPFAKRRLLLEKWAARAWQPVCLVSLAPEPGAAEFRSWLNSLRYRRVLLTGTRRAYWRELRSSLQAILDSRAKLVPEVAKVLDCYDPAVIEALSVALLLIPERRTVNSWAMELGFRSRQQLEALFADRALPSPKTIFDWLRLVRVVEFAGGSGRQQTRDELARVFRYPSGDYLGKRCKELTGLPLRRLVNGGVEGTLRILSRVLVVSGALSN